MNRPCRECKRLARGILNGNYMLAAEAFLTAALLPLAAELPFSLLQQKEQPVYMTAAFYAAEFLIFLLDVVLTAGVRALHLELARNRKPSLSVIFCGFKNQPDRYIAAGFLAILIGLFCALPAGAGVAVILVCGTEVRTVCLLAALAILSAFLSVLALLAYSQTLYLMLDHAELSAWKAMKLARTVMVSHKRRLFYMQLSFLGMQALCLLTLGIGLLWVEPYQSQTLAVFYLDVIGELPRQSAG